MGPYAEVDKVQLRSTMDLDDRDRVFIYLGDACIFEISADDRGPEAKVSVHQMQHTGQGTARRPAYQKRGCVC